ncbi:MAG: tRNA (adenosine(37)-N6)-dimethylallyltransferase MiaA [Candidatus Omnitrophica bacterium]|nr:tRNA (adenosine(37)-N6)-dimethylallyltransferase MiaA [Candidatus Omnitrophota bacterium]
MKDQVIFIVGPTASGKSEIAVAFAERVNGEIISCDSMQVYRGMDIGTAKPSAEFSERVKHHLIDCIPPSEEYSAARFAREATVLIGQLHASQKVPVVVGGSGLYMKALLDGIFPDKGKDPELRQRLKSRAHREGVEVLYRELGEIDAESASQIHPNDLRRIIRALELCYVTGTRPSALRQEGEGICHRYRCVLFGIAYERSELYARIEKRVEQMFDEGFLDEVRRLRYNTAIGQTASQALGYKESYDYLRKKIHLNHLKYLVKRNTRRFAKRQLTWFRRDRRIQWINVTSAMDPASVADQLIHRLSLQK